MPFTLSARSRERLAGVHPDLRRVVERAIQLTTVDFVVTQGNRTRDEQARLYGKGRTVAQMAAAKLSAEYAQPREAKVTWTLNSRHVGGFAVDLAPWRDGEIDWDDDGRRGLWERLAEAMKEAARERGIPLVWGGDWARTKDRPHFELPLARYPE
ncbi:M15 family metallopeptidase [Lysobacter enzymogenes]|uniref:M15 family metallopeptidase n=1 Tax=Lysobacter enzymogenes TaxID=69 RepID=UPI00089D134A|nr:M15 family metallopeptidase [Lysobacter enzymogenes]SDW94380.1 peptidoglycan L-alanyl-D-glutamate endopeptidase CwlK [Lysobacter enzymogenes]